MYITFILQYKPMYVIYIIGILVAEPFLCTKSFIDIIIILWLVELLL